VDGGGFGPFDGIADAWDWTFNESSYEGAITLNRESTEIPIEHRVVCEFNLTTITTPPPVKASLIFRLRGAPRFPAPDTEVDLYSYPADLQEKAGDFSANAIALVSRHRVAPFQASTPFLVDAGRIVNDALRLGLTSVAFRVQISPNTQANSSQAFMDALDADPATKPTLIIDTVVPGDADRDFDVDLIDFAAFRACLVGPGFVASSRCRVFDFDLDGDVDLSDFDGFTSYTGYFPR
jgi:hypothetical protein